VQQQPLSASLLTDEAVPDELAVALPLAVGLEVLVSELEAVEVSLDVTLAEGVCAERAARAVRLIVGAGGGVAVWSSRHQPEARAARQKQVPHGYRSRDL
jgi:hypothetical protein